MRNWIGCASLFFVVMAAALSAQEKARPKVTQFGSNSHFELAVNFSAMRGEDQRKQAVWMQGGSVQLEGRFWRGLAGVADVTGTHVANINNSGVGLDMVIATFGPRYTWRPVRPRRVAVFGQALVGVANGFDSVFPDASRAQESTTSLALKIGGGANYNLSRRMAMRLIEADWLRTQLPNGGGNVQNNPYLGTGLVLSF